MRYRVIALLVFVPSSLLCQTSAPDTQMLDPFAFLVGEWTALSAPGEGSGSTAFVREAQGMALVRRNHAEYPASAGRPAGVHDDVMIVYGGARRVTSAALYVDNEGHVIHYAVTSPRTGEVIFLSAEEKGVPRYKLWYGAVSTDTVAGTFEIAPPGRPNAFARYLDWKMVRTGNPALQHQ